MQTQTRDRDVPFDQWPHSFLLKGLRTRVRFSGFVVAETVASSGTMASKGQFITSTIATGPNAPRVPGGLGFTINYSRLVAETRTLLGRRDLHILAAFDAFAEANSLSPHYRLRSLFAEIDDVLFGGDLLVGQFWSAVADLESFPDVLDPEGPNSYFGIRRPQVRWTRRVSPRTQIIVSAEQPEKHQIQNAVSHQGRPDLVFAFVREQRPLWLRLSCTSRELVGVSGPIRRTTGGWGVNLSARLDLRVGRHTDYLVTSATWGKGIGSGFNDAITDAVLANDASGSRLEAIPMFGSYVGYKHCWSKELYSVFCHGTMVADNASLQPASSIRTTRYDTANLVWSPDATWLIGVEGQWGYRRDFDGNAGSASRIQVTTRYNF